MKTCGCGVEIDFVTTTAGKKIPVEVGKVTIVDPRGEIRKGQLVHWGRCKAEADYRKKGGDSGPEGTESGAGPGA